MASAGAPQPDPTGEGAAGGSAGGEDASAVAGASSAEAARPPPKLPTLAPAPEEEGQVATSSPGTRWARLSLPWISFSSPPNQHRGYGRVIVAARTVGFFPFCIRLLRFCTSSLAVGKKLYFLLLLFPFRLGITSFRKTKFSLHSIQQLFSSSDLSDMEPRMEEGG